MQEYVLNPTFLSHILNKTILITGGANGIGAATATLFNAHGAKVIISDLAPMQDRAESVINEMKYPENAIFIPADTLNWAQMTSLFKTGAQNFGEIDIVIANAGIMESKPVLDLDDVDENGDLCESREAFKVIDVNMKGSLNTLRLAMHHMKSSSSTSPKSIILLASTSGYFGGTGVAAYVASKHGIVGLLRASQPTALKHGIRINAVAPFFTPTQITAGMAEKWAAAGLEANTPERVAEVIAQVATDDNRKGDCILAAGRFLREMESTRASMLPSWLGQDVAEFMGRAMRFFGDIGGYVLPKAN